MNPHKRADKQKGSTKYRELLKGGRPLVASGAPGAWHATLLENAGVDLIYSGANHVTRPLMGVSRDVLNPDEFTWINHWIARATNAPVIIDLDNGFGGHRRLSRIIEESISSGVAAGRVEDESSVRRPLWWPTPPIAPRDEAVSRIRAIAEVRDVMDPDFVIMAFCKVLDYGDENLDEAIARLQAFQDAGADVLHISANSVEQVRVARQKLKGPLMATGTDGRDIKGLMTVEEHKREGMALCWYSNLLIWKLNAVAVEWLDNVKKNGFGEWVKFHEESQRNPNIGASIQQKEVDGRMDAFERKVWAVPGKPDEDGWLYVPGKMEIEGWEYMGGQPQNKANWRKKTAR